MKFIARIIFLFFANAVALFVAAHFVSGFSVTTSLEAYLTIVGVFTLIYLFIRPIIKLLLTPVIIITFGLGVIVVNALTLYILDWLMSDVLITGLIPLLYATLIIGLVNVILGTSAKSLYKNS